MTETLIFLGFSLILSGGIRWTWRQRELAQRQAELNARLAELGRSVDGVAHDMANLINLLLVNLQLLRQPNRTRDSFADVEDAARALRKLLYAMRQPPSVEAEADGSTEGVVRLVAALLKGTGTIVELQIGGDLPFRGSQADAIRVIQNLLSNAAREASQISGACVRVELRDDVLMVTNPVRQPAKLDDTIYTVGVSHSGSSGTGLDICRSAAGRLGWSLRHEVHGDEITFVVQPTPPFKTTDRPS